MEESDISSKFDNLIKSGAVRYDARQRRIGHVDKDLHICFVISSALANKPTLHTLPSEEEATPEGQLYLKMRAGSDVDTRGFEFGGVRGTHFLAANKFCFARPHLMLLTEDAYRRQYEPLDSNDLEAAWAVLTMMDQDYVAFFNCGKDGGCSRLHKHLQLLPMPETSFATFLDSGCKEPHVPFQWFYYHFKPQHSPEGLIKVYSELLDKATKTWRQCSDHAKWVVPGTACPHNMILTKRWMIVLPRRTAAVNNVAGVNAMGMLGLIAVAAEREIDEWVRLGVTEALRGLGVPG